MVGENIVTGLEMEGRTGAFGTYKFKFKSANKRVRGLTPWLLPYGWQ